MNLRPTAVAGSFYPDDAEALQHLVKVYLATNAILDVAPKPIKALVVPHAGYIYSGEVAAKAYAQAKHIACKRVIILGPSHRVAYSGIAACKYQSYDSPLGEIRLDTSAIAKLVQSGLAVFLDEAHRWEHSIEVQIPFIQALFPQASLIPLVVGDVEWPTVKDVFDYCYQDSDLIVISTDLSHYHNYNEAKVIDENTNQNILQFQLDIAGNQACGSRPLSGLLAYAKQQNWQINCVDLRNSGDTAGAKDRVVGYGAYVLY